MIITLISILIILFISNIFLLYKAINLVKFIDTKSIEFENEREYILSTLEQMYSTMQDIDIRGSFESDDEVGATFTDLKNLIAEYKSMI